jgi:hypothetical protein
MGFFSSPRLVGVATLGAGARLTFTRVDDQPLSYAPRMEAGSGWTVLSVSRVNAGSATYLNKERLPVIRGLDSDGPTQIGRVGFDWRAFNANFDQKWNDAWIAGASLTVEIVREGMFCPADKVKVSLAVTLI